MAPILLLVLWLALSVVTVAGLAVFFEGARRCRQLAERLAGESQAAEPVAGMRLPLAG